jgi:methylmalonyl-CoA mutase N-terminal domain/subunit
MQKLFTEFTSTTAAQWKEQLVKDLKGIDYNTLVWKTNSGIDVQPFYTKENLTQTQLLFLQKTIGQFARTFLYQMQKQPMLKP